MTKCEFCGKEQDYFKGINYIKNDGSVHYFCSGKCKKNSLVLKRDKRKIPWTEAFHKRRDKAREKEAVKKEV